MLIFSSKVTEIIKVLFLARCGYFAISVYEARCEFHAVCRLCFRLVFSCNFVLFKFRDRLYRLLSPFNNDLDQLVFLLVL